jgi:hypothetical protein
VQLILELGAKVGACFELRSHPAAGDRQRSQQHEPNQTTGPHR